MYRYEILAGLTLEPGDHFMTYRKETRKAMLL